MGSFQKLVRDNIPDIIRKKGETPKIRILNDKEYYEELVKKIGEEYHDLPGEGEAIWMPSPEAGIALEARYPAEFCERIASMA